MSRKKVIVYILIAVFIFGILYLFFTRDGIKSLPVKKLEIQSRVVKKTVSSSGEVKSKYEAELSFPTTKKILKVYVSKGDVVDNGALLAQQENYGTVQDTQYYKDARDIKLRQRDLFLQERQSNIHLLGGETEYNIRLRQYDEELSQAEAAYQSQRSVLNDTYMYAPFDSTVVDVYVEAGEVAAVASPVVKIADLQQLEFEIDLDQEDYGLVSEGQEVEIELDSFEGVIFNGFVTSIPYYANGGDTANFTVEISFMPTEDSQPLMGMMGDAKIVVSSTNDSVNSLFYDEIFYDEEDNPYVWVLDNGLIEKYPIETGLEGDIYTEVKTDLSGKEVVIGLNDDVEMKEGYKAKIAR